MRPGDRGDRRAHGLEARPVQEGRAAPGRRRDLRHQYLGPVDHRAVRRLRCRAEGALLRRALLQSAALHASGRADPDRGHAAGDPGSPRSLPDHHARQGRGARQGHAELHRQPRRHLLDPGRVRRGREIRHSVRRGRRPDRQQAGPRQVRDLPHRRRGGPGHDGPRDQDHAGQPAGRSVRAGLPDARGAQVAGRCRRAGPEDRRRLLQEGRQADQGARREDRPVCRRRRQGRRDRRPHAEEGTGRAHQAAARIGQPAGAVPVGDLPRRVPLHRRLSGADCRFGRRRRPGDPLGLRLELGPVRGLAGRRLAAGRAMGQGRHRGRQGAVEGAAARLGLRRPGRRQPGRAFGAGLVVAGHAVVRRPQRAAGLSPPGLPRRPEGQ